MRPDTVLNKTPYHLIICSMEDDPFFRNINDDDRFPHANFVSVNGSHDLHSVLSNLNEKDGKGRSPLLLFADIYPNMIAASRLTVEAEMNGFGAAVLIGGLDKHEKFYRHTPPIRRPERTWKHDELLPDHFLADEKALKQILNTGDHLIIDTRKPEEFNDGHIANAINLPYSEITDDVLNSPHQIIGMINNQLPDGQGIDDYLGVMTMCAEGINACLLALAIEQLNRPVVVNNVHIDQTLAIDNNLSCNKGNKSCPVKPNNDTVNTFTK